MADPNEGVEDTEVAEDAAAEAASTAAEAP